MRRGPAEDGESAGPLPAVPVPDVPEGLRRDSVTGAGYLVLATWGWFLYGFGALLPQLGDDQGISRTLTSLHSVALATGGLVAGLSAVPLVRALRRRGVFLLGCSLAATGCVMLAAGGAWTAATLVAALVAGTGGSLLINTAMPTLSDHHGGASAAALAEGNAVAAGTGLVAPLVVGAGIAAGLTWRPAVLLTLPLLLAVVVVLRRQPRVPALDTVLPPRSESRLPVPPAVWPVVLLIVLCVGRGVRHGRLVGRPAASSAPASRPGGAAAGVSAVIAGMTLGRLAVEPAGAPVPAAAPAGGRDPAHPGGLGGDLDDDVGAGRARRAAGDRAGDRRAVPDGRRARVHDRDAAAARPRRRGHVRRRRRRRRRRAVRPGRAGGRDEHAHGVPRRPGADGRRRLVLLAATAAGRARRPADPAGTAATA